MIGKEPLLLMSSGSELGPLTCRTMARDRRANLENEGKRKVAQLWGAQAASLALPAACRQHLRKAPHISTHKARRAPRFPAKPSSWGISFIKLDKPPTSGIRQSLY